jgi:hypothetical protein
MEERALRVAALFEHRTETPAAVDGLLAPLFRYAYLKGLAEAVYEEGAAGRLCARLYQRLLGPAVVALVKGVSLRDPALPRSDIDAILAYAA